jgi:titin
MIGTDVTGTRALRNAQNGVILTEASYNSIGGTAAGAGNLISGNGGNGVAILGSEGLAAAANLLQGNSIGTDVTGTRRLNNAQDGIALSGTQGNVIGGAAIGARNLVSGNIGNGISVTDTSNVAIVNNLIGTDVSGRAPVPNGSDGVLLVSSSVANATNGLVTPTVVGVALSGNVVSGNGQAGIEIRGAGATRNVLLRNTIGLDLTGEFLVGGGATFGNAEGVEINGSQGNTIGVPGAGNLISGNSRPDGSGTGILILGLPSSSTAANVVQSNEIGTDRTGEKPLGNDTGIIVNGAAGNTIGGTSPASGNLISGNIGPGTPGVGVLIEGAGAVSNSIEGNLIGTDLKGARALTTSSGGRFGIGILISSVTTAGSNIIGGTNPSARNVIAGFQVGINLFAAVSATPNSSNPTATTSVLGNYIGTDATGTKPLGNTVGLYINGIPRNVIGGTTPAAANVISGNQTGLYLLGSTATGNLIMGNLIGLDPSGTIAEGNHTGIFLDAASGNTIGGASPAARNVIAGNVNVGSDGSTGIYFFDAAAGNMVLNNFIGTDINGRTSRTLGQGDYGVLLFNAPANSIPTRGATANRILGSGIAPVREFTGSVSAASTSSSSRTQTKASVKAQAARVPNGPRALMNSKKSAHRRS